jgi:hypothetical protein
MTMCAPIALDRSSASFRLARNDVSSSSVLSPCNSRGGTLISMLNCPSSVWKSSLAMALSTSALRIAGLQSASTRLSSISSPVIGRSNSNFASLSIRENTSRQRRTLAR